MHDKKHTALFQTHNWEISSFFSTLLRVFTPLCGTVLFFAPPSRKSLLKTNLSKSLLKRREGGKSPASLRSMTSTCLTCKECHVAANPNISLLNVFYLSQPLKVFCCDRISRRSIETIGCTKKCTNRTKS